MDILSLSGLQYHARHGYYESERDEGNDFEVDLIFYADLSEAGKTDKLSATIDYQQAEQIVRGVMDGPSVKLIETLATRIGDRLFAHFATIGKLKVRIRKLGPPLETEAAHAQVVRTWTRL